MGQIITLLLSLPGSLPVFPPSYRGSGKSGKSGTVPKSPETGKVGKAGTLDAIGQRLHILEQRITILEQRLEKIETQGCMNVLNVSNCNEVRITVVEFHSHE